MKEVGLVLKKNTAETLTLAVKKKRNKLRYALTMQGIVRELKQS